MNFPLKHKEGSFRMFTLFKRELKSLILKPFTMVVFVLSFLVPAIIFSVFLSLGPDGTETQGTELVYAGFESLVSIVAIFFAVVIPAVVIFVNRGERKEKNYNFLITFPLSRISIMLSKLLALIAYFALPLLVMAIYPLVFSSYGEVNFLQCYLSLIMLALLVIFVITLSFMVSVKKASIIVAGVISYSALALSYLVGVLAALVRFLPFGTGFDSVAGGILTELSIFKKLDKPALELFAWSDVIFFVAGITVFVVIASLSYGKDFVRAEKKREKSKIDKKRVAVVCSSLILVVCIGVLPSFLPYSIRAIDVSGSDLYSPEESLDSFFENIEEDITIYLLNPYSGNTELYTLIMRTAERSDRITLEVVNPMEDTEILQKYGISGADDSATLSAMAYAMIIQGERKYKIIQQSDYYVFSDGKEILTKAELDEELNQYKILYTYYQQIYYQTNTLTDSQLAALEQAVQRIEHLQSGFVEKLNVEAAIASAIEHVIEYPVAYSLIGHGEDNITSNSFDLSKNTQVPKDAEVLVVNSPSEDYSESDIAFLKSYVDNGGKLYILADTDNYSMPNFSALLKHYGLTVEPKVISVGDSSIVDVAINKEHGSFKGATVESVRMVGVSKISVPENAGKYTYEPLLNYVETVGEGEDAVKTSYPVAVSVNEGNEKKVVLFTGAKTVNDIDSGLNEDERGMSSMAFLYSVSWLYDVKFESSIPNVSPKDYQKFPYVTTTGDVIKNVIIFAVVIPAAVLFSAVVYSLSRRLRSNRGKNGNPEIY